MGMYFCEVCAELRDGNYHPSSEHPDGLVCPACVTEKGEEIAGEDYIKPRMFSADQLAQIKQWEDE